MDSLRRPRSSRATAALCVATALLASCGAPQPRVALAPPAAATATPASLADAALRAVATDARTSQAAVAELRAAGPAGLDALFRAFPDAITLLRGDHAAIARAPAEVGLTVARVRAALEHVARQRDAHAARLFWYTDLAEARRVAAETGRPVLSLRMLGQLDDEYSCANSRFFRTALYPDAEVARYLRDHFVLHWSSERPVPRATIDFGDGRVMERTVTGNSIHYVLDARGRVVEALPGLYGPRPFLRALREAEPVARATGREDDSDAAARTIRAYHEAGVRALEAAWHREVAAANVRAPVAARMAPGLTPADEPLMISAIRAVPIAVTKSGIELPFVRGALAPAQPVVPATEDEVDAAWRALAARHRADARLDGASLSLMRNRAGAQLGAREDTREVLSDEAFGARVVAFERSVAEDTLRNEFVLHRTLRAWLIARAPDALTDLRGLNARVYAELFLTPRADPWLGLLPRDSYPALDHDGLTVTAHAAPRAASEF